MIARTKCREAIMRPVTISETAAPAQVHSDDLTPEIRIALTALAAVEIRHEVDHDALNQWSGPEGVKKRLFDQLEARHARERAPLVQRLAELHHHRTVTKMFLDLSPCADR
jgi:hypothetical protein